jgi:phospholipid transport system substrate-binding protein
MTMTKKTSSKSRLLSASWECPRSGRRRARLGIRLALGALLVVLFPFPCLLRAGDGPRDVVQRTTDAVLGILQDKSLGSDDKRARIEEVVYAEVDFPTLTRLVLARNWGRFTPEQKKDFEREFKQHLSVTYGKNVDNYKNERVQIVGDRKEIRDDWTVQTRIIRGGPDDIAVEYRLRQREGQWRIIDVIVEGVSLVANFRSQFQEIISNRGVDHLIKLLREKNAKGESVLPPSTPRAARNEE